MTVSPSRLAYLHHGTRSPEQAAALEWARDVLPAVDAVPLVSVADGSADLARYDVCWWHADSDPSSALADGTSGLAAAFADYLDGGGGLLLTLRAVEAVEPLGIDRIGPDAVGVAHPQSTSGFLVHPLYEDHPAFAGFDDRRIRTLGPGHASPHARYEALLPADGHVLAGGFTDEHDRPDRSTVVWWPREQGGAVLGVGASLSFADRVTAPYGMAGASVVEHALAALAAPEPTAGMRVPVERGYRDVEHLRAMRRAQADAPNKPTYHLTAPANWLNDPNGLVHWNGRYHLFYQYNPGGAYHGSIHWGHATSADLVTWRDEPVALSPDPDGPDRDGCWSGCTVVADGEPILLYTGGRGRDQLPCRATTDDVDLRTWRKDPANPVIAETPTDPPLLETDDWATEFRDHCVWEADGTWYHLVGSGVAGVGGTVLLYKSTDPELRDWEYRGPVLTGDGGHGVVWECPELLRFNEWDLLHVSNGDHVDYFVGHLDTDTPRFEVVDSGRLDHGDFYAPQSTEAPDGRVLTWGWLPEERGAPEQWDAGWSGAMSLPREVWVDHDGRLHQRPAEELAALRGAHESLSGPLDESWTDLDLSGQALELDLTVALDDADGVELGVLEAADGEGRAVVRWEDRELRIDRAAASEGPVSSVEPQWLHLPADGTLTLRVFVDHSVVEVFAGDGACLTSRVYPGEARDGVSIRALGGRATVDLDAWRVASTWE